MKFVYLLLVLLSVSYAHAQQNQSNDCGPQTVTWDSDGHSPYQIYAECIGDLAVAPSGVTQSISASVSEEAGNGVGGAAFICIDGTWKITRDFNCAD